MTKILRRACAYVYARILLYVCDENHKSALCGLKDAESDYEKGLSMPFYAVLIYFRQKKRFWLCGENNYHYFCIAFERKGALSSAGSERLPYKQRVGGSNPSAPTRNSEIPFTKLAVWQKGA